MSEIQKIKNLIEQGKFPKKHKHFAGAGLIITNDPSYTGHSDDIVICTIHAGALSWLVYELKRIYYDKIDYMSKYDFYPSIGLKIKEEFCNDGELIDVMIKVIENIEKSWK